MNKWQPIESAPKDGTRVLLWSDAKPTRINEVKRVQIGYWHQPANPEFSGFWTAGKEPSHWRSVPEPPKPGESATSIPSPDNSRPRTLEDE